MRIEAPNRAKGGILPADPISNGRALASIGRVRGRAPEPAAHRVAINVLIGETSVRRVRRQEIGPVRAEVVNNGLESAIVRISRSGRAKEGAANAGLARAIEPTCRVAPERAEPANGGRVPATVPTGRRDPAKGAAASVGLGRAIDPMGRAPEEEAAGNAGQAPAIDRTGRVGRDRAAAGNVGPTSIGPAIARISATAQTSVTKRTSATTSTAAIAATSTSITTTSTISVIRATPSPATARGMARATGTTIGTALTTIGRANMQIGTTARGTTGTARRLPGTAPDGNRLARLAG